MSDIGKYKRLTRAELISRLSELEDKDPAEFELVRHELSVHQEELRVQNEQLLEAQRSLEASRNRYAELYDFAPLAYVSLDGVGQISNINLTGAALLGRERGLLIGTPLLQFIAGDDREQFLDYMRRCRQADGDVYVDLSMKCHRGRVFPAQLRTHRTPDGESPGGFLYRTAITDLTEYRRAEEEKREALLREHAARAATQVKDQFIAMVSHELRTPLSAILLWAHMLRDGQLKPADYPKAFEAIEQSAGSQQRIIDDLLDISRVLSGKLKLAMREVEVAAVLRAALETVRPSAEARAVALDFAVDDAVGVACIDSERIQQVVWNLLTNAIKFTDPGGRVRVSASHAGQFIRISVSDTGRGIDPGFLPYVFERFRQADPGPARSHGGLGLGLAIVKEITEMHGGRVWAESQGEGRGSTFTIDLPAHQPGAAPSDVPGPTRVPALSNDNILAGVSALLIEDDPANRRALEWVLKQYGAAVQAVESADEAVAAFQNSTVNGRFDVIVSDIGLPSKDGYCLIREIRHIEEQRGGAAPIPAVALTAFAREQDRERAIEAGFQTHVAKPVKPQELINILARLTRRLGQPTGRDVR